MDDESYRNRSGTGLLFRCKLVHGFPRLFGAMCASSRRHSLEQMFEDTPGLYRRPPSSNTLAFSVPNSQARRNGRLYAVSASATGEAPYCQLWLCVACNTMKTPSNEKHVDTGLISCMSIPLPQTNRPA